MPDAWCSGSWMPACTGVPGAVAPSLDQGLWPLGAGRCPWPSVPAGATVPSCRSCGIASGSRAPRTRTTSAQVGSRGTLSVQGTGQGQQLVFVRDSASVRVQCPSLPAEGGGPPKLLRKFRRQVHHFESALSPDLSRVPSTLSAGPQGPHRCDTSEWAAPRLITPPHFSGFGHPST